MPRLPPSLPALILVWAAGCAVSRPPAEWASPRHRDHPLVGRVWDVRGGAFSSLEQVEQAARAADYVLLGETHDNPDHHLLQARLVAAVAAGKRRPALAFEMLDTSQQAVVDQALSAAPGDPDALAHAVGWAKSGWPSFELYRPVFAAGLEAGLPIVPANLPREALRAAMRGGLEAADPRLQARLEQEPPLSEAQLAELTREMTEAHCGHLPVGMMESFVLGQRLRDAHLSLRLAEAGSVADRGAILIAGAGHVRADRGVPVYLARDAPGRSVLAIGFREVEEGAHDVASYGPLPFDFVVFTPAAERGDPCEALRSRGRGRGPDAAPDAPPPAE